MSARRGWFVSSPTKLVRVDTKREATTLAEQTAESLVLRECECGCGKPASKAYRKAGSRWLLPHREPGRWRCCGRVVTS